MERVGSTALVTIDNPPVNASSVAVRRGLEAAVTTLAEEHGIDVIAVYGAGRTSIAGADIREFGHHPVKPFLTHVCDRIEASPKPGVAVLHGTALGGDFEAALAAHARIALPGTRMGLPEVTLGVLPGAGGTQRVPRLAGIRAAIEMILDGRHIPAEEVLEMGLIDRMVDGEPRDVALAAAEEVRRGTLATRRCSELETAPDDHAFADAAERVARSQRHLFSPAKCIEAIRASTGPIEEGLKLERRLFLECLDSPQRAGLIHAFFAKRALARIPEVGATPRRIETIGLVGGGTMGSGIATAALLAGFPVTLVEREAEALARGRGSVESNLAAAVARGKLAEDRRGSVVADAFRASVDLRDLAQLDLVVEAIFEDLGVKTEVFRQLDEICKVGASLATNTSYLDIDRLAAETSRASDVIGLHFFSLAHVMRLLGVVVGERTAPDAVATGFALAKRLRKVAVRAGVCDGFIGNRILGHQRKAADHMMMDGAEPWEIDGAIRDFGFAMGPFEVSDLAGLDIG